jgi:hypothetical protein
MDMKKARTLIDEMASDIKKDVIVMKDDDDNPIYGEIEVGSRLREIAPGWANYAYIVAVDNDDGAVVVVSAQPMSNEEACAAVSTAVPGVDCGPDDVAVLPPIWS